MYLDFLFTFTLYICLFNAYLSISLPPSISFSLHPPLTHRLYIHTYKNILQLHSGDGNYYWVPTIDIQSQAYYCYCCQIFSTLRGQSPPPLAISFLLIVVAKSGCSLPPLRPFKFNFRQSIQSEHHHSSFSALPQVRWAVCYRVHCPYSGFPETASHASHWVDTWFVCRTGFTCSRIKAW